MQSNGDGHGPLGDYPFIVESNRLLSDISLLYNKINNCCDFCEKRFVRTLRFVFHGNKRAFSK